MISSETLKKIRRIQIVASRMATDLFAGQYRSAFRGRGLEWGQLREYEPGDDIRAVDWNVTARTGRLHVKKFLDERAWTVLFVLDLSPSLRFGTAGQLKSQLAAEIFALLSFTALRNRDRIGLLLFTDRIERYVAPRTGGRHVLRLIREVLCCEPAGRGTNLALALDHADRLLKRRTILFVLSDLLDRGYEKPLSVMARKHDTLVMTVNDPAEVNLPEAGLLRLEDGERGHQILMDADARLCREYRVRNLRRLAERQRLLRSLQVDAVDCFTDVPYLQTLISFFRQRERRIQGWP
jgi:uncharacterized protein (DUF58 family)